MIKIFLFYILLLLILPSCLNGQSAFDDFNVLGNWKVVNHQICLHMQISDSNAIADFKNTHEICLNSIVTIDSISVRITPINACNFTNCYLFKKNQIENKRDSLFLPPFNLCNILTKNSISQQIINLLISDSIAINYYKTSCSCGFDDCTYRLIIVNNNQIVFFSGMDFILLERII